MSQRAGGGATLIHGVVSRIC